MPLPAELLREVSRDAINALPVRRYEGPIEMVVTLEDLDRAIEDFGRDGVIGWDTETRPAFRKGESYLPALLQAATARAVYLFRFPAPELEAGIAALFAAPKIAKAGISVADDLKQLKKRFEFTENSVVDLGRVAHAHGMKQTGLRNLAGIFLGCRITKGTKTTNWEAPKLSAQQLNYAATDAWICRELYLRFLDLRLL